MPIPEKGPKEDSKKFLDRCLSSPVMNKEYPDTKQRYAICQSQLKKARKKSKGEKVSWDDFESENHILLP